MPMTTCRDEILNAVPAIIAASKNPEFRVDEVVRYLQKHGTKYSESTIRTHIISRMCANAPDNHAVTYDDFVRVAPGVYRSSGGLRQEFLD